MPGINKFRVANVNFANNQRRYDDLIIPFYLRNGLIEGSNGDGKTLYAQCAFQTIIPNTEFHEKNTIKRLFTDNQNSTIHSMIEWELDNDSDYYYMITGFCAKDNRKENEENRSAFVYFNYVILYDKNAPLSIESIPLREEKNGTIHRMGYKALKDYLRKLDANESRCVVKVFDSKGEYQNFLFNYGIDSTEWELLFKTNAEEGGAETYFTSRFKKPKDLIVKEIIPIIESINKYTIGDENSSEILATTLLNISEHMKKLSEKSQRIDELNILEQSLERLVTIKDNLSEIFNEQEQIYFETIKGYNRELIEINKINGEIESLEKDKSNMNEKYKEIRNLIDQIEEDIHQNELHKEETQKLLLDINKKKQILKDRKRKENLKVEINNFEIEKKTLTEKIKLLILNKNDIDEKINNVKQDIDIKIYENKYLEFDDIRNNSQKTKGKLKIASMNNEEVILEKRQAESKYLYVLNNSLNDLTF